MTCDFVSCTCAFTALLLVGLLKLFLLLMTVDDPMSTNYKEILHFVCESVCESVPFPSFPISR